MGRKHEPSFRLVLTDSKNSTKSGRFNEILGSYDPRKSAEALDATRIKHWIAQGAGLTDSVNNLLIKKRIINGKKIDVSNKVAAPIASVAAEVPVAEAPVAEALPVEIPAPEAAPVEEAKEEPKNDIVEEVSKTE